MARDTKRTARIGARVGMLVAILLIVGAPLQAQEICDGYDNNGDGTVDEGCDGQCDDPQEAGPDRAVSDTAVSSKVPSLVWSGGGYGVAWHERVGTDDQVFFRRFDAEGGVVGSVLQLTTTGGNSFQHAMAWGEGAGFGLVWRDTRDGTNKIYFNRVDAEGNRSLPSDIVVSGAFTNARRPSLVWFPPVITGGPEFAAAFRSTSQIAIRVFRANGSFSAPSAVSLSTGTNPGAPSLAWANGNSVAEFGVAWHDQRNGNNEIYFSLADADGNKVGNDLRVTADSASSITPSLAWNGSEFGVAWNDSRDGNAEIYFARVSFFGTVVTRLRITNDAAASRNPSLTWNGQEYLLSWEDDRSGVYEIYATRLTEFGMKIGTDVQVSTSTTFATTPSIAWNGTEAGIAWTDSREPGGTTEIYFDRLRCCDDADGDGYDECEEPNDNDTDVNPDATDVCDGIDNDGDGQLDGGCVTTCDGFSSTTNALFGDKPDVVWTGSEFGVILQDCPGPLPIDCETRFQRRDEAGSVVRDTFLSSQSPDSDIGQGRYALAWNGAEYGAVFVSRFGSGFDLFFQRISAAGDLLDEIMLVEDADGDNPLDIVWTGSQYLVAWGDDRDQGIGLYMMRVGADGTVLQRPGNIDGVGSGGFPTEPSMIWTGAEAGLAYSFGGMWFVRLGPSGGKLGPAIRLDGVVTSCDRNPSVAWTGSEYAVAWDDCLGTASNRDIYFARINGAGQQIDSPLQITTRGNGTEPSLAWSGSEFGLADPGRLFRRLAPNGALLGSELAGVGSDGDVPRLVKARNGFAWVKDFNFTRITCCSEQDWHVDDDGDGYGDPALFVTECGGPPASVADGTDCDDSDAGRNPGSDEVCDDGLDNDCNASTPDVFDLDGDLATCDVDCDDTDPALNRDDLDGDTVDTCDGDCDDTEPARFPGNPEVCADGLDNDCNGATPDLFDLDGDLTTCDVDCDDSNPVLNLADVDLDGVATCAGDCDDTDPARFPGNPEICDGLDNDCSGPPPSTETDPDADGYAECAGDCAPFDPATYPGAVEINDGVDNQCPTDPGYGAIDEVSGVVTVEPDGTIAWPAQTGATLYQLARSTSPDYSANCVTFVVGTTFYLDTDPPPSGESFYYIVRSLSPFTGSWGLDASGMMDRTIPCGQ